MYAVTIPLRFRIRLWLAIKCMTLANWILQQKSQALPQAEIIQLTPQQMQQLEAEFRDHTLQ